MVLVIDQAACKPNAESRQPNAKGSYFTRSPDS